MQYGSKTYLGNTEIVKSYIGSQQVDIFPQKNTSAGTQYAVRTDPQSTYLTLAMPMQLATNLGMSNYYDDISGIIRGEGSGGNISLVPTGSNNFTTSSVASYGGTSWATYGYQTSGYGGLLSNYGAPTTTQTNFGSSNFVIEAYVLFPELDGAYHSTVFGQLSGDYLLADCSLYSPYYVRFYSGGSGQPYQNTWTANTWNHVAYVRSGNTYSVYVNGTRKGTFNRNGAVPNSPDGFWRLLGYADNSNSSLPKLTQDFRLYIGTDKGYTGTTITPPPSIIYAI
jgi:hypothetical protein